jgi:alpha-mannosidase
LPKTGLNKRRKVLPWLAIALAIAASASTCLRAQISEDPLQRAETLLGLQSKTVLERLEQLAELPDEPWRFCSGEEPQAESPALDDSGWQLVGAGSRQPQDTGWYRRTIVIPKQLHGYDLAGARIWFEFRVVTNGPLPEVIFLNGHRIASGEDLEPIILRDFADPQDRFQVTVKLSKGIDIRRFRGARLKIEVPPSRPSPEDLRVEMVSALTLIPAVSKDVTGDIGRLERILNIVDLGALDLGRQAQFDASLKSAQDAMNSLRPLMDKVKMHLTGNSHIDAAWLWPWSETTNVVKATFGTALQLMDEYPTYTFTQSAAQYNDWISNKYPSINEAIKERIRQKRWEVVGGMWIEPDLNMPDGESIVRSLLLGKRFFQKEYGVDVTIGWNPDSFGYSWQLPQIYKRSGIDTFVTQKMNWNDTNHLPFKLFWWESPDGSRVLTYFPRGYANKDLNPIRLSKDFAVARRQAPGLDEMLDLYGVGDHGGGPTRAILDEGMHWEDKSKIVPRMEFGTARSFFDGVKTRLDDHSRTWTYKTIAMGYTYPTEVEGKISIPTWDDEMYLEYHRGIMTSQATQKRNIRDSEVGVLNAEKYASLAWIYGDTYPSIEFENVWKTICFNDFHDLAAGSGVANVYREAQNEYENVRLTDETLSATSLKSLASRVDTQVLGGVPLIIVNPLAWERSEQLEVEVQMPRSSKLGISVLDSSDHIVPSIILGTNIKTNTYRLLIYAKRIPSLGYEVFHVVAGAQTFKTDLEAAGMVLENSELKVVVDPKSGCITSLFNKRDEFELLARGGCGNQLQTFDDKPKDFDAWNIDPGTLDKMTPLTTAAFVKLVEHTPMRAVIRVSRAWGKSTFVQDIELDAWSDFVNVTSDIDWHEDHVLLKAAFPLSVRSPEATYEIPYGTIGRPTTQNNSWEKARFEVPALRWADLGDGTNGFSLLNNSKYGYDVRDSVVRLTLLRSPTWPDPNADRGHQHFTYALFPHSGTWKASLTELRGYEYNYPALAFQANVHPGSLPKQHSFLSVNSQNVVLTSLKKADDSDGLILRFVEWAGKDSALAVNLPGNAASAVETDLMEKPIGPPLSVRDDVLNINIHPYEIRTFLIGYPKPVKSSSARETSLELGEQDDR